MELVRLQEEPRLGPARTLLAPAPVGDRATAVGLGSWTRPGGAGPPLGHPLVPEPALRCGRNRGACRSQGGGTTGTRNLYYLRGVGPKWHQTKI